MKILNLYAGIGGNRKLWGDEHEITAVENEQDIADDATYAAAYAVRSAARAAADADIWKKLGELRKSV